MRGLRPGCSRRTIPEFGAGMRIGQPWTAGRDGVGPWSAGCGTPGFKRSRCWGLRDDGVVRRWKNGGRGWHPRWCFGFRPPDIGALATTHLSARRWNRLHQVVACITRRTDDNHGRAAQKPFRTCPQESKTGIFGVIPPQSSGKMDPTERRRAATIPQSCRARVRKIAS